MSDARITPKSPGARDEVRGDLQSDLILNFEILFNISKYEVINVFECVHMLAVTQTSQSPRVTSQTQNVSLEFDHMKLDNRRLGRCLISQFLDRLIIETRFYLNYSSL